MNIRTERLSRVIYPSVMLLLALSIMARTLYDGFELLAPIPWQDHWKTLFFIVLHGKITITDIFSQHNEHRIPLTHLTDLADMYLFGGRYWLHFLFVCLAILMQGGLFTWLASAGCEQSTRDKIIYGSVVFGILFCRSQLELFFWPFCVGNVLSSLFVIITLSLLPVAVSQQSQVLFGLSILAAILSIFGLASGVLVWPLGLLILFFMGRGMSGYSGMWILVGCIVLLLYFHGYMRPTYHANPLEEFYIHTSQVLSFFLLVIGAPVGAFGIPIASAVGAGILIFSWGGVFLLRDRNACPSTYDLSLLTIIIFQLLCAVAMAGSRSSFGLEYAFTSRYTTISLVLCASVFALRVRSDLGEDWLSRFMMLLTLLVTAIIPVRDIEVIKDVAARLNTASVALKMNINDVPMYSSITPSPDLVPAATAILKQKRLSIFRGKPILIGEPLSAIFRIIASDDCLGFIDSVEPIQGSVDSWRLSGWASFNKLGKIPDRIALVDGQDHRIIGWAIPGWSRPDVAEKKLAASNRSGWKGYVKTGNGTDIRAFAVNDDLSVVCPLN